MVQKGQVKLKMERAFGADPKVDGKEYLCEIMRYEKDEECIYLLMKDGALTDISNDSTYRCQVPEEENIYEVTGRIQERYCSEEGNVLEFKIENGVYRVSAEQNIK